MAPATKTSAAALREQLGALYPLAKDLVEIEGPDGKPSGHHVEMHELTAGARLMISEASAKSGADGEQLVSVAELYPRLIAECAHVPGSGERLWTVDQVRNLPHAVVTQLGAVALKMNGLAKTQAEDASGNGSEASADSSSTSPTN